jgi:hypothetical protein
MATLSRVITVQDSVHLGCPVLNKTGVFVVPRGLQAILRWQLRNAAGEGIDLTTIAASGQIVFRFIDAYGCNEAIHQIVGTVEDGTEGWLQVELTAELAAAAGLYLWDLAVVDSVGVIQAVNNGLLSVERGLFPTVTEGSHLVGPITINELRMSIRDYAGENDLLQDVEFDDAEIVTCLIRPIQEWNETPPDVVVYCASEFPFRHHWLTASTGYLLRLAAHWYARNKAAIQHGGVSADIKDKDNPYMTVSKLLLDEWRVFVSRKKAEINMGLGAGTLSSPYSYRG